MNLNELWSGNDYALFEWRGRGEVYRSNAKRVKIIRTFKEKAEYGNKKLSGYAEVMLLDEDGNPLTNKDGTQRTTTVRSRDIAMRWLEYVDERDHREAQRAAIQKAQEEADAKENEQKSILTQKLYEVYGIKKEWIYNITVSGIHLNKRAVESELGIAEE